jgi:hypothetical protein
MSLAAPLFTNKFLCLDKFAPKRKSLCQVRLLVLERQWALSLVAQLAMPLAKAKAELWPP